MNDKIDIQKIVKDFYNTLPKFDDGRIDYSKSNRRPILTCFLKYEDKILLLKRSDIVGNGKEKWSTVTGYLDELIDIDEKAYIEVKEETGINRSLITEIHKGEVYEFTDDITWVIYPVLFVLSKKPNIILNWEHTEYDWIYPEDMNKYNTIADLYNSLLKINYK